MAHAASITELWTLSRGDDAAQCLVAAHPLGVELRYLMNHRPLITRVFQTWDDVTRQAALWRDGLEERGWGLARKEPAESAESGKPPHRRRPADVLSFRPAS
jgi:hypothetical protein